MIKIISYWAFWCRDLSSHPNKSSLLNHLSGNVFSRLNHYSTSYVLLFLGIDSGILSWLASFFRHSLKKLHKSSHLATEIIKKNLKQIEDNISYKNFAYQKNEKWTLNYRNILFCIYSFLAFRKQGFQRFPLFFFNDH